MSYVLDRDGLAACPDDPARVASPIDWNAADEAEHFADLAEAHEWHFYRVKPMVVATMAGLIASCPGLLRGKIEIMEANDLWETITKDADQKCLAKVGAGYLNRDAHSEAAVWMEAQIDVYCNQMAAFLAKAEIGSEE